MIEQVDLFRQQYYRTLSGTLRCLTASRNDQHTGTRNHNCLRRLGHRQWTDVLADHYARLAGKCLYSA